MTVGVHVYTPTAYPMEILLRLSIDRLQLHFILRRSFMSNYYGLEQIISNRRVYQARHYPMENTYVNAIRI